MKNKFSFIEFIAILGIIAFVFIACSSPSDPHILNAGSFGL